MKQNLEIEYKILIDEARYRAFLAKYPGKIVSQTNFYYDNALGQFKSRKISCRIRSWENETELTFKFPQENSKQEITFEIQAIESAFDQPEVVAFLAAQDLQRPLFRQGELTTVRTTFPCAHGLLCLDLNRYNGRVDYELEYEVDGDEKKGLEEFRLILASFGLIYEKNCDGKIKRCLSTLPRSD